MGAAYVRIPPGLGESILKRDLPADFEYRIMLSGIEGWLFLDGGDCSDSRKFDLATGIVQPGDLVIHGDTQYQGLGRRIMRNQIEFFHAIGMKTLRIIASRKPGGYTGPRMGFLPDMPLNPESAHDMKRRYDLIKPFLAAGDCPAALPLPPNEARDLWVIAAKGEWGAGAVMVGIGLLFFVPLASALTGIGRGRRSLLRRRSGGGAGGASRSLSKGDVPIRRWDR